jgi:hypothetical protein
MTARETLILPPGVATSPESKPRPRVLVAIPSPDQVNANFAMALATTLYLAGLKRIPCALANVKGSVIHRNRNNLVAEAKRLGCAKILFIDADMTFPVNVIERLLSYDKQIVGATYAQRSGLHKNHAKPLSGGREDVHGLVEVAALPGGLLLIDMAVFDDLKRPYFRMPFTEETETEPPRETGEDYDFCNRARAVGYQVWLDTELSFDVIHWGEAGWRLDPERCGADPQGTDAQIVEAATGEVVA